MAADCSLCRQLEGERRDETDLVWEFPHSVAFLGPWQFFHGYCVLVSRRHARELSDLDPVERADFLREMCVLAAALENAYHPRKLNYELLGNQVPHLHWHLFPRYDDDPDKLKPVWVSIDRAERDAAARQRLMTGRGARADTIQQVQHSLKKLMSSSS